MPSAQKSFFRSKILWTFFLWTIALAAVSMYLLLKPQNTAVANSFWDISNENNAANIDHAAWQHLLDRYLVSDHASGINRFNYDAVSDADKHTLESYLGSMQQLDPRNYNRDVQQAYWINLYNALTIKVVLDEYPVESITTISEDFVSFGPWDDLVAEVQGQALTLNDIEHRILRPIWNDNRIHYAVNCASIGCPNLSAQAFTAANLEAQLEAAAVAYVNHPRGVHFDNGELQVSSIYHWYKVDFGNTDASLLLHLQDYAKPPLRAQLENYQGNINHDYDWNLNDV